jgi:hypothetical protein
MTEVLVDGPERPIAAGSPRLCGYSRCRKALPDEGTGRKLKYCRDREHRTSDGRQVGCRQAGQAEELLAALLGPVRPEGPELLDLATQVDAALPAVTQLHTALEQVAASLTGAVATALAERDDAVEQAAREAGLREAADRRADRADDQARDHQRRRSAAETDRDRAAAAAEAAERAAVQAGTRAEDALQRLARTEREAAETVARAHDAERALATTSTDLAGTRQALEHERHAARTAAERAEAALRAASAELTADRRAAQERLDGLRAEHAEAARRAADEAHQRLEQLRAESDHAHRDDARQHATRLADLQRQLLELHQRLGGADQRLTDARGRADAADALLRRWRTALTDALAPTGPPRDPGDDSLVAAVGRLLTGDPVRP